MKQIFNLGCLLLSISLIASLYSCEKKTVVAEATQVDIEMSYTPNPAVVNTAITFTFEAVEAGADHHDDGGEEHHFELSMVTCEIHHGDHEEEMTLIHHDDDDHYEGEFTFDEAETFELHLSYMYEGETFEKEFVVVVNAN